MSRGDFNAVVDTLEFDTGDCFHPHVIHAAGDIFAVVYRSSENGVLKTFTIAGDGQIGAATIGSFTFESTDQCFAPRIIRVSGTTYLIVFSTRVLPGETVGTAECLTVTINPDGTVGSAAIDTLQIDGNIGRFCDVILISGDVYAVVFEGSGNDGFVATFTVDAAGTIGNATIDSLEYETNSVRGASIALVSGTIYAIAYRDLTNGLDVATVAIETDGQIAAAVTDSKNLTASISTLTMPIDLLKVAGSGTAYLISYTDTDTDGQVLVVSITDAGTIGSTVSTLEYDTSRAINASLINVVGDLYAIAYSGPDGDGFAKSFRITAAGVLSVVLATLEFDTLDGSQVSIATVVDSVDGYVVAYRGVSGDGFVKTLGIRSLSAGQIWVEKEAFHYVDENTVERFLLGARVDHAGSVEIMGWLGF